MSVKLQNILKSTLLPCLLLGLAVSLLYGWFLWNPIVFDDLPFFMVDNEGKPPIADFKFSWFEVRSLPYASIAWTANMLGLNLINFRVEALLLHATVGIALFFFMLQLYRQVLVNGANNEQKLPVIWLAFFAALLFVLHPVAVYGAAYLVQRTIVMATLFSLLAMLAYVHGSVRHKPLWLWASVPLYYLAVFSKEHAIMLPAVLLALTMLLHGDWRVRLKQRWVIFAAFTAIAVFVLLAKKGLFGTVYEINAPEMLEKIDGGAHSYPLSILTQSALFFKYLALWLLPNPAWMSVDMREPFADSLLSPYWFALLGFIGYGVLAVKLLLMRGKAGLIGFALLFPWLFFLTEFSTVRIQESFVLYRSYLWMGGLFAALPALLGNVPARRAVVYLLGASLLIVPLTWNRLTTFSHPLLLWDDAASLIQDQPYSPGFERIYYNRGLAFYRLNQKQKALEDYNRVIAYKPDYSYVYNNRGEIYFGWGRYQEALQDLNKSIELKPEMANPYLGRGLIFEALHDIPASRADFQKSCELGMQAGCDRLLKMGGGYVLHAPPRSP